MPAEEKIIQLGHGAGGLLQNELIDFITKGIKIRQISDGIGLDHFDDGATIPLENSEDEIVITADGHTIHPLIFPGGDLGKLSICGTVNDLLMMGAKPLAITSIVLIEEGTSFEFLGKIMQSFNQYAKKANVAVLAGDTKVMPKGSLKEIVINTTGIGIKQKIPQIFDGNCKPKAKIILTGSIGDHGAALIAQREGIDLETKLISDVNLLTEIIESITNFKDSGILAMKDPTRGGISSALNEWAKKSKVSIWIDEEELLIKQEVKSICGILGLDPMEMANEGKALICIEEQYAQKVLDQIRTTFIGKEAKIIGEVKEEKPGMVIMKTSLGGKRIIEMPMGEPIPRIC